MPRIATRAIRKGKQQEREGNRVREVRKSGKEGGGE